jgi:hypothetical protein
MPTYNQPKPAATQAVLAPTDNKKFLRESNVSVANNRSNDYKPTKTSGIKIRGTGAATKGVMARGPMA